MLLISHAFQPSFFSLVTFDFYPDRCDYKGFLLLIHFRELRWPDVQLVEGIVGKIRLAIPSLDQFFASSALSSRFFVNPWNFCIHSVSAWYSPGSSTISCSRSSGVFTP